MTVFAAKQRYFSLLNPKAKFVHYEKCLQLQTCRSRQHAAITYCDYGAFRENVQDLAHFPHRQASTGFSREESVRNCAHFPSTGC